MVLCGLNAPRLDFAKAGGMLDIGGFDATVPEIINKFITDKLDHWCLVVKKDHKWDNLKWCAKLDTLKP